jgi:hypothetical protein
MVLFPKTSSGEFPSLSTATFTVKTAQISSPSVLLIMYSAAPNILRLTLGSSQGFSRKPGARFLPRQQPAAVAAAASVSTKGRGRGSAPHRASGGFHCFERTRQKKTPLSSPFPSPFSSFPRLGIRLLCFQSSWARFRITGQIPPSYLYHLCLLTLSKPCHPILFSLPPFWNILPLRILHKHPGNGRQWKRKWIFSFLFYKKQKTKSSLACDQIS